MPVPPTPPIQVTVIIPARNAQRTLGPLLDSLAQQTLARGRFETVVVDNASSDATASLAHQAGARVVHEPIPNRARARNRGALAARSPLLAFTDADCVATPGWLEALLAHPWSTPLVAGDVLLTAEEPPNLIERFERLWRFGQRNWVAQGWAATANLAVTAEAFRQIGGFDASWRHIGEDVDFCLRARAAGLGLSFCPEAVVTHAADRELRALLGRSYRHGYSTTQGHYRLGSPRAWRTPTRALWGDRALRDLEQRREDHPPAEWRRLARVARMAYAARVAGSVWAEATHAR